jgi:hypothetical protein
MGGGNSLGSRLAKWNFLSCSAVWREEYLAFILAERERRGNQVRKCRIREYKAKGWK